MTIYNFNETTGGGTPIEVEVNQLKIGDIIITNKDNVAAYNLEGVDLLKLTDFNQIVNAADYPKLAELSNYQYQGNIIDTQFFSDISFSVSNSVSNFFLRDEENTFLIFEAGTSNLRKLNSDNTTSLLKNNFPLIFNNFNITKFINFDNFTKVLCLTKESNIIKSVVYNKIDNTVSTVSNIITVDAATGQVFAARLMSDGLIYIGILTTAGNVSIFRTSDGIVYENYYTTTLTHFNTDISNIASCDEYGTMNIDENFRLYFLQQSGTNRTLGFIDLINKQKTSSIYNFTTISNLSTFFAINIRKDQILLFQSQSSNVLNLIVYNKANFFASNYSISLNNNNSVNSLLFLDYNNIFIRKNSSSDLVYINQYTTQYNYNTINSSFIVYDSLDFRYNNIIFLYKNSTDSNSIKRTINVNEEFETLFISKQVYFSYQSNSYLVTDINAGE